MAKIKLAADFSDFLKLCLQNNVRFMVIGGYAVIHHSRPRYTGDPIDWNVIFGPDGYLPQPVCPLGGTYTFVETIPPVGTLVGSCSHADHVPADHSTW